MKSLPRIVKEPEKKEDVKPYDFFAGFKLIEEPKEEDEDSEGDAEEDEENAVVAPLFIKNNCAVEPNV